MSPEFETAQPLRFLVVGLASTATHFVVLTFLYKYAEVEIVLASILAFAASLAVSYLLNRSFTFRSQVQHRSGLPRYLLVTLLGLLWNVSIMYVMVEQLSLNYYLSFVCMSVVVAVSNYLFSKKWVFHRSVN